MKITKKHTNQKKDFIHAAAERWAQLCIAMRQHKKQINLQNLKNEKHFKSTNL